MKALEIPYNFDKNLIDALFKIDASGQIYHCIYVPPFWEDYISAKYNYVHYNGKSIKDNKQMTRQEYEAHISYINFCFPNKLMLLLQQNNSCISQNLLQYYYNLGFKKFCVGNVAQAQNIRQLYPKSEIIGSITMKISPKNLEESQYSIFDGFVLWFPYNRNIDTIKLLPQNYKYILLVNCDCSIYCKGTHHWFASAEDESQIRCPSNYDWKTIIRIDPYDLSIFEPYITYFKLQGREYLTNDIIRDIVLYSTDFKYLNPSFNIDENKYQTGEIFYE